MRRGVVSPEAIHHELSSPALDRRSFSERRHELEVGGDGWVRDRGTIVGELRENRHLGEHFVPTRKGEEQGLGREILGSLPREDNLPDGSPGGSPDFRRMTRDQLVSVVREHVRANSPPGMDPVAVEDAVERIIQDGIRSGNIEKVVTR